MQQIEWKKFFVAFAVLVLVGNFANSYYERRDRQASLIPLAAPATPEVRVTSSSQSSDGVTAAQLTPELASRLEQYGANTISAKLVAMAKQTGAPSITPKVATESTVIQTQGKTLVVIRYQINGVTRAVETIGIAGSDLQRVMCTRDSLDGIPLTVGPCAKKIQEVHGVAVGG